MFSTVGNLISAESVVLFEFQLTNNKVKLNQHLANELSNQIYEF